LAYTTETEVYEAPISITTNYYPFLVLSKSFILEAKWVITTAAGVGTVINSVVFGSYSIAYLNAERCDKVHVGG